MRLIESKIHQQKSLNASQIKLIDAIRGDPLSKILAIRIISNPAKQMRWPSEKHDGAKAKNDWKELKKTLKKPVASIVLIYGVSGR